MQKSCEFLALEIFYTPPRTFALGLELSYYRRFLSHFWPSKQSIKLLLCPLKLPRLFLTFQTAENRLKNVNAAYISINYNLSPIAIAAPLNIKINSLLSIPNYKWPPNNVRRPRKRELRKKRINRLKKRVRKFKSNQKWPRSARKKKLYVKLKKKLKSMRRKRFDIRLKRRLEIRLKIKIYL